MDTGRMRRSTAGPSSSKPPIEEAKRNGRTEDHDMDVANWKPEQPPRPFPHRQPANPIRKGIIIIGAGASGIAAATRLYAGGQRDFLVLEAEGHIGGRIKTVNYDKGVIDLGAQWIHGISHNCVADMCANANLILDSEKHKYEDPRIFLREEMRVAPQIYHPYLQVLIDIEDQINDDMAQLHPHMHDLIETTYRPRVQGGRVDYSPQMANETLDYYLKSRNLRKGYKSWIGVHPSDVTQRRKCDGDQFLIIKQMGFKTILEIMMGRLQARNMIPYENFIRLNTTVKLIKWTDQQYQGNVEIECEDGAVFETPHCIITLPLGVLKSRYHCLFQPLLPDRKMNAIYSIDIGYIGKIFLEFNPPFWPADWNGFSIMWTDTSLHDFKLDCDWIEFVPGVYSVEDQPNMIVVWVTGHGAKKMEEDSLEEVTNQAMKLIRYHNPQIHINDPIQTVRTNWSVNPNFKGSHSYRNIDTNRLNVSAAQLAEPIYNNADQMVLQFAGEATHPYFYSTVHGAIESGYREADRLLNILRHQ